MKKLFLLILLTLFVSSGFSQTRIISKATEIYYYNEKTEEWDLYQKNADVEIAIVLEDDFITIDAKRPSMFKIFRSSSEEIKNKNFSGSRFRARDLRNDSGCLIDIVKLKNGGYLISIIPEDKSYNLRYYIPEE